METSMNIQSNNFIHHFTIKLLFTLRLTFFLVASIGYLWFFTREYLDGDGDGGDLLDGGLDGGGGDGDGDVDGGGDVGC